MSNGDDHRREYRDAFGNDVGNSMGLDDRIKVRDYLDSRMLSIEKLLAAEFRRLEEVYSANDRRYEDRWKSDQQALREALQAAKEAVAAALQAAKEAVGKAENASDARFNAANNVKAELDRKYGTLLGEALTRLEYDAAHKEDVRQIVEMRDAVTLLTPAVARLDGSMVGLTEKTEANSAAILSERSRGRGGSDQEDKSFRETEAKFARMIQSLYVAVGAMGVFITLFATHVI